MTAVLTRIAIRREENEDGEMAYTVTPTYLHHGVAMTVPDSKGWATRGEAIAEVERIVGVPFSEWN